MARQPKNGRIQALGHELASHRRLRWALLRKQVIRDSRDPTPSESLKVVGGRRTACPHIGEEPRPALRIVAWQITTPGRSATAAAAGVVGFVDTRLSRGVRTQLAADGGTMVAGVSRSGHPTNRQDKDRFARRANGGEIAREESEASECR